MSVTVGRFQPASVKVSITDGRQQIEFDRPSDLIEYLKRHPELAREISDWGWTTQEIQGGS